MSRVPFITFREITTGNQHMACVSALVMLRTFGENAKTELERAEISAETDKIRSMVTSFEDKYRDCPDSMPCRNRMSFLSRKSWPK